MRYWWVNQNQTYQHEVQGGYLWSPKLKKNGALNPYYEFMREVSPGDLIFSYASTKMCALGIATSHAYEAPKPLEFGQVGAYWDRIGWRIDVRFRELANRVRPVEHIDRLRPYFAKRYAPLQSNGNGLQNIYLTEISALFGAQLIDLIGTEARAIVSGWNVSERNAATEILGGQVSWEEHEAHLIQSSQLGETEKQMLVVARRGQGLFRQRVSSIEKACRVTGVTGMEYLRASHVKPWRDSNNDERLNGENGLMLSPDVDQLFDRGFIGFENNGDVLVSPVVDRGELARMGLTSDLLSNVGSFSEGQKSFLEFHRESVFLEARVSRAR